MNKHTEQSFEGARIKLLDKRMTFLEAVKKRLLSESTILVAELEIYEIGPFGTEFQSWLKQQGIDGQPVLDTQWRLRALVREVQQGDAVSIRLLNSAGMEEEFSGQVIQIAVAEDGSKSYITACPFRTGPEHIRVIVPVEDMPK